MGTQDVVTLRLTAPWRDPRTGIWKLRKRVPTRYRAVAGIKGDTIKISTGAADRREAERRWPGVLDQWASMEADWERKLNVVSLTPERANTLTAGWVAWIAAGHPLETAGETSDLFEPLTLPEERTPERVARMWDRVEAHAKEAQHLAGITVSPDTWPLLVQTMVGAVNAAYLEADLRLLGVSGAARAVNPVAASQAALPVVPAAVPPARPELSLASLLTAWEGVAVVKARTVDEVRYIMDMLGSFLGHTDASRIGVVDMRRWRDAAKVAGLTNNTWNNRLSMARQVFAFGVADGLLPMNPADNSLRLAKSKAAERLPYSDADARRILTAARKEETPTKRWAHWIMAFTGMRVGEVLQLTTGDVRQDGGIWFLAVNEDDPTKSVKTGNRRSVPIHPALVEEGFLAYVATLAADVPVFPDKMLDKHGNRGGRGWNAVGKWVRGTVGITDPKKAPNHSWRHRVEDELRAAEVPEDLRDAIVGHARKTVGRSYGVRGEALARLSRAVCRIPSPLGKGQLLGED